VRGISQHWRAGFWFTSECSPRCADAKDPDAKDPDAKPRALAPAVSAFREAGIEISLPPPKE